MAKQTFTTGQVLTAAQMTSLQQTAMLGGSASAKVASYTLVAADAGTTVSMSNASATTITVNTGLFAAGDTVTILNVGVGTCTITAGTATVSKPTNATLALVTSAGGVLYFTATGAATFLPFDVGAGASTSGLTLITTATASAASTVSVNNCFSATYTNYLIVSQLSGSVELSYRIRLRVSGTDASGSDYPFSGLYVSSSSSTVNGTAFGTNTFWPIGDLAAEKSAYFTYISDPFIAGVSTYTANGVQGWNGTATDFYQYGGAHRLSTSYDGFTAYTGSGTMTGTIYVYGYAKA